ncbi:SLATT-fungal domain-containing protein [Mycena indigotica]|uniref:SLATT-fungal domain-containing protein n=1 Tax=Mycena indigotica TaxID=2126181 RepID=A0A8H6RZP0_9AGAR|nr:SLATT-fungal domain-containing protein [Mycena indigotica]KAF7290660.1 SLATT-fungal domain-containing protein [Mycena indigotica]
MDPHHPQPPPATSTQPPPAAGPSRQTAEGQGPEVVSSHGEGQQLAPGLATIRENSPLPPVDLTPDEPEPDDTTAPAPHSAHASSSDSPPRVRTSFLGPRTAADPASSEESGGHGHVYRSDSARSPVTPQGFYTARSTPPPPPPATGVTRSNTRHAYAQSQPTLERETRRRSLNLAEEHQHTSGQSRPVLGRAGSEPGPAYPAAAGTGSSRDSPPRPILREGRESRPVTWVRTASPERIDVEPPPSAPAAGSPRIFNTPAPYAIAVPPGPPPGNGAVPNGGGGGGGPPPQPPPKPMSEYRRNTANTTASTRPRSELDWIVPVREPRPKTVEERLRPTIETAQKERRECKTRATLTGYGLNAAIGLQVVFGALTTGLSAALSGHKISIMTAVLGGMSTIVASYLARVRGSHEPEHSIARGKDLDAFIRDCEVFVLDHGHTVGAELDDKVKAFRDRFEELMSTEGRV